MTVKRIAFLTNHYYHIYNRGVNRETIFFSDKNYLYFTHLLKKNMARYSVVIVAYCLMPNHFHFLLTPRENDNVSKFMSSLFGSYTQAINKQQGRQGPLFQGRFCATVVDKDEYLAHLARYIHLNPVMAGFVNAPEAWAYSNYLDVIGRREGTLKDIS